MTKRIGIIGAGWTGVGCLVQLREAGYEVDVFEVHDDVGGTWHRDNNYAGLQIHAFAGQIEYADFPLPSNIDRDSRIPSDAVFSYLRSYAKSKSVYKHIRFRKKIVKIKFGSPTRSTYLIVRDLETGDEEEAKYDYVVFTPGYTQRDLPDFEGKDVFRGQVVHALAANAEFLREPIKENKNIVVVGGSKTAADFICYFDSKGYKVSWVYRLNYWFFHWDKLNTVQRKQVGLLRRLLRYIGFVLGTAGAMSKWPLLGFWTLRLWGLVHTFGEKHNDFERMRLGSLTAEEMKTLRRYAESYGRKGEIERLNETDVQLTDGRRIPADLVICCTGSTISLKAMPVIELDGEVLDLKEQREIYRHRVIPAIPTVVFTAFYPFSTGTVNGLSWGNWLKGYIGMNPSLDYLKANVTTRSTSIFSDGPILGGNSKGLVLQLGEEGFAAMLKSGELAKATLNQHRLGMVKGFFGEPLTFNFPLADEKEEMRINQEKNSREQTELSIKH